MAGTFTLSTFIGVMIPFAGTTLGSACVFFLKGEMSIGIRKTLTGFAAGVMVAASFWSLLNPSLEMAEKMGRFAFIPAAVGFLIGMFFLLVLDLVTPHMHLDSTVEGPRSGMRRTTKLILAVTLHNIPEGMAVGVALAAAMSGAGSLAAAMTLSLGIALQNLPEGAAVSLPLRREGVSAKKCFLYGQASGMVEPIAGVLGALLVVYVETILPYALAFAAGAMILVAVHELIPECQKNQETQPYFATMGIVIGFATMMLLDVMLG
jgi:ZIP family zinc transporter